MFFYSYLQNNMKKTWLYQKKIVFYSKFSV